MDREPPADRPGVLDEEAEVVHRRVALRDRAAVWQTVVAGHLVVAERAAGPEQALAPEQLDSVAGLTRERVEPDAVELDAGFDLVLAGGGDKQRAVDLDAEVRTLSPVPGRSSTPRSRTARGRWYSGAIPGKPTDEVWFRYRSPVDSLVVEILEEIARAHADVPPAARREVDARRRRVVRVDLSIE